MLDTVHFGQFVQAVDDFDGQRAVGRIGAIKDSADQVAVISLYQRSWFGALPEVRLSLIHLFDQELFFHYTFSGR